MSEPSTALAGATESSPKPAAVANPPLTAYRGIQRFNYTDSVQNFIVPPGVTSINARCWGGGGKNTHGGGGGFATGDIAVQPGETLLIVVDMGGAPETGGGMSGIYSQRLGAPLLIAGGGGAGGVTYFDNPVVGGPGGGSNGADGGAAWKGASGTPARGASGSKGGEAGFSADNRGGRGGDTGQNGGASSSGRPGGQVPIPGMGGGGGASGSGDSVLVGGGAGYAGGGGGTWEGSRDGGFVSAGAGGSSFVDGPGVTNGRTIPGSGMQAGGKDDPLYQPSIGDAYQRGQVVVQWSALTVVPGGPPTVQLTQGGDAGYPGVRVTSSVAVAPVSVTVALPADSHMHFGTPTLADYQLTVQQTDGKTTVYVGVLSADGTSLTFRDVNLPLPGTTTMWVAVSAGFDTPAGETALNFTVGEESSASTRITIKPAFSVSASGAPVTAQRGGSTRYPGVRVRNNGSHGIPPQQVTVTLPTATALLFGTVANPDYQLTIQKGIASPTVYRGEVSGDGRSLMFTGVNLAVNDPGDQVIMWVGVSAAADATTGPTTVTFTVGDQISPSTTINVT
jgi:hypothetical protein